MRGLSAGAASTPRAHAAGDSFHRLVLVSLSLGLSAAALIAIVAVLSQSFNETDGRLIGTSLGFSVFSALGAAGARARQRSGMIAALGAGTAAAAAASFALLVVAIWNDGPVELTRTFGALAVATLAASHSCLILSSRRRSDTALITGLGAASIAAGATDAILGALPITGVIDRVDSTYARALAVLVIVLLLSTALPPILRRMPKRTAAGDTHPSEQPKPTSPTQDAGGAELDAIARRLDELAPQAGALAWRIQAEAAELRRIATSHRPAQLPAPELRIGKPCLLARWMDRRRLVSGGSARTLENPWDV